VVAGGVLVSNSCFLQQNTTASLLELYFSDSMQTVFACGGGGGGSRQRQVADVADGADVVFTDTVCGSTIVKQHEERRRDPGSGTWNFGGVELTSIVGSFPQIGPTMTTQCVPSVQP